MPKDELRDVDIVLFVNLDRNSFAIVEHWNEAFLSVDFYFEQIHPSVSVVVISCIHKYLVEYFVEGWDIMYLLVSELQIARPKHPFAWLFYLCASYVGIWSYEDVFKLRLLLVDLFDGFLPHCKSNYTHF